MENVREIIRNIFSILLLLTCLIGCGQSLTWMAALSSNKSSVKTYKYNYKYYDDIETDTIDYNRGYY